MSKNMDYEIREKLDAVVKAVRARNCAGGRAEVGELRGLDENVCLTSRSLYMRFKSSALWCRSVDRATRDAVGEALEAAVGCLPECDYPPDSDKPYLVRGSVSARWSDFEALVARFVQDPERPEWFVLPFPTAHDRLQPA